MSEERKGLGAEVNELREALRVQLCAEYLAVLWHGANAGRQIPYSLLASILSLLRETDISLAREITEQSQYNMR